MVKPPDADKPPQQAIPPQKLVQPPSVDEVASRPPVIFGEGEAMGQKSLELRFSAPQDLHVRPATTINRILRHFQGLNPGNNLLIPSALSDDGSANKSSGLQPMTSKSMTLLDVKQGRQIDLVVVGPNSQELAVVLHAAFEDNFQKKSGEYMQMFEAGQLQAKTFQTLMITGSKVQDMPPDVDFRSVVRGDMVLEGQGAGTGMAVCGKVVQKQEYDYTQQFGLCSGEELSHERLRLQSLEKVMTLGRTQSAKILGFRIVRADKQGVISEIREGEADFISDVVRDAMQVMSGPLDQQTLDSRGIGLQVGEPPNVVYPNAELAIELAVDWNRYPPEDRPHVDEMKRTLMYRLVDGLDIKDTMGYVLSRMVSGGEGKPSFRRAGVYLLNEDPSGRYLETRYEWKDRGFFELDRGFRIELDKQGDGTAYVARMALDSGRSQTLVVDDVRSDQRTNRGYTEHNRCAWSSIHDPAGEFLGVIWADNRDEGSITQDMMGSLEQVSKETGELVSMTKRITKVKPPHQGDIAVFNLPPTGDHVIGLTERGWSGFASRLGNRSVHGVIVAGNNRFPGVVGLGEMILDMPNGSIALIADPADSRNAVLVINPKKETLSFFGLSGVGDSVSIEPDVVDVRDTFTKDGFRVHLRGSLQGTRAEQVARYVKYGSEGVGLFRSEFAMINDPPPFSINFSDLAGSTRRLEEYFYSQYFALTTSIAGGGGRYAGDPVILRLLDITPEKYPKILSDAFGPEEAKKSNGLKFLLDHPPVLEAQSRAVCRVAAASKQEVMVMMSNVQDLGDAVKFKDFFDGVQGQVSPGRHIRRIAQIETSGAIYELPGILNYADGVAFGTNDLTVRIRGLSGRDASSRDEFHPQVLRALKAGVDIAKEKNAPCLMCGCLAESPEGVALLIGLGVNEVSVPSRFIPEIRRIIPNITHAECESMIADIFSGRPDLLTPDGVYSFVRSRIRRK